MRHPEGSNGGVHRGPDLTPRKAMPAVALKALIDEGLVVTGDGIGKRAHWRKRKKQRYAMIANAARGLQRVFEDMAAGDQAAYGHGIRLFQAIHEVLQPAKDEGKGVGAPFGPRFERAPQTERAPTPSPADEPGSVVDRQGNVYVDGDG